MIGPVRRDVDALVQHAQASLAKIDNATAWLTVLAAKLEQGKTQIRVAAKLDPPGLTIWLEPKE